MSSPAPARAVTEGRWATAQRLERHDWRTIPNIVAEEWTELTAKFGSLFPRIARDVELRPDSSVLDVGCGPTVPARLLGTGQVTGIDPLADSLGISGTHAVPGVTIVNGKGEFLPFPEGSFDLVVCRNAIDHTQDPAAVMREVRRVLKDGGHLLLFCYVYAPFVTWLKRTSERLGAFHNLEHPHTYTPVMLEALSDGLFDLVDRFTIHTGQHSTDYGKVGHIAPDPSRLHRVITWVNRVVIGSPYFLKEYGYRARKR